MSRRAAGRWKLLLVAMLFALPLVAAVALHWSGWRPQGTRNFGEMLSPPLALQDAGPLYRADGQPYPWRPEQRLFRVAVFAPGGCAGDCAARIDLLHRVWQAQGRHADRMEVLWFGDMPAQAPGFRALVPMADAQALRAGLPHPAGDAALYVIDPRGFLILAYPPGFDANGLRKDLARLLK